MEDSQVGGEDNLCNDEKHGREVSESVHLPYVTYSFDLVEDWLQWRLQHIGASETPAILGVSPFMTRFQCLKRKLGMEKFKPNAATEHGKALEPKVREMMEVRLGEKLDELVLQSKKHPHLVAQIDGLGEKHQIEIKCPYRESSFIEMVGKIPEHYVVQMQHQMLVTGRDKALFVFYYKGHLLLHSLSACRETQDMIVAETLQFVEDLQTAREANRR